LGRDGDVGVEFGQGFAGDAQVLAFAGDLVQVRGELGELLLERGGLPGEERLVGVEAGEDGAVMSILLCSAPGWGALAGDLAAGDVD